MSHRDRSWGYHSKTNLLGPTRAICKNRSRGRMAFSHMATKKSSQEMMIAQLGKRETKTALNGRQQPRQHTGKLQRCHRKLAPVRLLKELMNPEAKGSPETGTSRVHQQLIRGRGREPLQPEPIFKVIKEALIRERTDATLSIQAFNGCGTKSTSTNPQGSMMHRIQKGKGTSTDRAIGLETIRQFGENQCLIQA